MDTHVADDAVAILHECPPTSRVDKRVIGPHWSGTGPHLDRKSTRLNSSHSQISYAVFCLKKKKKIQKQHCWQLTPPNQDIGPMTPILLSRTDNSVGSRLFILPPILPYGLRSYSTNNGSDV